MATLEQIAEAIRRADAAGNADDVRALGQAYRALQSQGNGAAATANASASAASQRLQGKVADLPSRQPERPNLLNSTLATVNGLAASVPFLQPAADAIGGGIAQMTGGDYGQYVDRQKAIREGLAQSAPLARGAGEVAGLIAAPLAAGSTKIGAEALGLTGSFGQRFLNSGLSGLGIGTADALSNGGSGLGAIAQGALSGGVGAAMPVLGAGFRAAGRGIRDNFIRPLATLANRENEVTKRIAGAIGQDRAAGAVMGQGTEAVANRAGADVLNADRFGSAIRTLARTASNVSPEADNIFKETTQNRFYDQGKRAINYVRALMGGATDDLALQDNLRAAARATNKTAYDAAYNAPMAKAIWTPEIRNLLSAEPFKQAVRDADKVGANYAAISGQKAVRNPFTFDADGNVTGLRQLPGGGVALPNLEFWDIVQRSLRNTADQAKRSGDNLLASQVQQMRSQLLNTLDGAVPQFQKARQGAAGFFGAEDAIDAGRKAVTSTKAVPEIERAVASMSQAEKDAFSVGFSSEIIDAIGASRDRVNVINSIFGSESARKRIAIALGPQRARELEAYVKMEQILDMLRVATQGNSTTAKQLIQAGLMGGGAGGLGMIASGGDLATGFSAASVAILGRRGLQMLGKSVDDQVMKRVAEVLSSTDPAQLQRAIQNASLSQQHMDAIDGVMRALAATSRGAGVAGATAAMQPAN